MIKALAVAFLCGVSVILFNIDSRHETVSSSILPNLDFSEEGRYWNGTPGGVAIRYTDPPVLVLKNKPGKQTVIGRRIALPLSYEYLRIGADFRMDAVVPGPIWWQRVGFVAHSIDEKGKRMTFWPSQIALLDGTRDWQRHEIVLPISPDAKRMDLIVFMGARSGVANLRNFEVDGVKHTSWFSGMRLLLMAAWIIAGIWTIVPLFARYWKRLPSGMALVVFLSMLGGILAPQPELSNFIGSVRSFVDKAAEPLEQMATSATPQHRSSEPDETVKDSDTVDATEAPVPKQPATKKTTARVVAAMPRTMTRDGGAPLAHFAIHALLAFLVLLALRQPHHGWVFASLLLTGIATEIIQYFVVTRTVNPVDGALNLAGIAAGYALGQAWNTVLRMRNRVPARGNGP